MNKVTETEVIEEVPRVSEPRVCAVVLTCNRLEKSRQCIDAILCQSRSPDRILVVDNGSTDGTVEWVMELAREDGRVTPLPLAENLGPAGGYAEGFQWVEKQRYDRIWAVDDDVYPQKTCLKILLDELGDDDNVLVYPWTTDEPSGEAANYPRWSGVLIPVRAIREAGVPRRDLFWWIEDTEYLQWRLPRELGMRSKLVERAHCVHDTVREGPKAAWKYYYEVRNTLWYRLRVQEGAYLRRLTRIAAVLLGALLRPLLKEDHKLAKLRYVGLGFLDGLTGRLGKRVDPAAAQLRCSDD